MFTGMKKAAANFQATSTGHAELSMAIYQEKCVQEAITNLIATRKEATAAWLQYANSEKSEAVSELFLKMNSVDEYWLKVHEKYYEQYESFRGHFQQILKGERTVDEFRKAVDDYNHKIAKIQKQIDSLGSKGKDKKYDALSTEKGKYLSMQQKAQVQLDQRKENHSLFKYKNIKDAVKLVTDAQITLHESCFEIFQTQRLLLDYFTATTYNAITKGVIKQAKTSGNCLLDDLGRKLGFHPNDGSSSSPFVEPSKEILDELADVFGTPSTESRNAEELATYNPIPEEGRDLMLSPRVVSPNNKARPLPSLPPTAPEEEMDSPDEALYVDPNITPNHPPQPDTQEPYQNQEFAPPIPPRKEAKRNSEDKTKEDVVRRSSGSGKVGGPSRKGSGIKSDPYLEMSKAELRPNSVYESSDCPPKNSYLALSEAYSGSRGSSIKSTGSSSSKYDSGLESRGSTKSNASHDQQDQEEDIYEILDGRHAAQKKFSQIEDEDLYEI